MHRSGVLLICIAAATAGQALAQNDRPVWMALSADRADCLAGNAELYLEEGLAARPISVASCPKIASRQQVARQVTRNGLFQPTLEPAAVIDDDSVIIFSRRQLECLRDHYDVIRETVAAMTDVGTSREVVELKFERCP